MKSHLSRQVTINLLNSFPLILTMESDHKEALQIEFPEIASRVFMLSEMTGMTKDVSDPVGKPLEDFRQTVREIEGMIDQGLDRINRLANEPPDTH